MFFSKILIGLETEIILKIAKPINSNNHQLQFFDVKDDGSFLAVHIYNNVNRNYSAIVMLKSGKKYHVNLIEKVSKDESNGITTRTSTWRGRNILLQTANEKGYLVDEVTEISKFPTSEEWRSKGTLSNYRISKYDSNGVFVSSLKLPTEKYTNSTAKLSVSFKLDYFYEGYLDSFYNLNGDTREEINRSISYEVTASNRKSLYFSEDTGDEIVVYRITDSDLLSSPNRITLGSSQNGSLTATVNNPEQALLNIQSSTNLIDWNTFKTIKNEPSLGIVVPANKTQEFIRAVE